MNSIGIYTSFAQHEVKFIETILTKVQGVVKDFAIYNDGSGLMYNNKIPVFSSASLIHFTGSLIVFSFGHMISANKVAHKSNSIHLVYCDINENINPISILGIKDLDVKIFCTNEECFSKAKRLFGNNFEITKLDENLSGLV